MPDPMENAANSSNSAAPLPDQPHKKRGHGWAWLLLVVLLGGGAFLIFQRHATGQSTKVKAAPPALPVLTAAARKGDVGVYINALGTVTPVYTVTVTSRVQGEITSVNYREGQMVHKGDPLIDIDPRPYQAQLTEAEGQLAHDQAVLNEARIDMDRYKEAFARNAIAKQQLDDQEQAVLQDQGTVKNDEGQVANAKVNLIYCHITSPIDGRVGLRLVDPGNNVQANSTTALVVVTQLQPITVIFSVAEDYLPQVQQQLLQGHVMAVDALDRAQQKILARGSLSSLDNQIDPTTGTLRLRAQFANSNNALFPSQFVNARLLVETQRGVTLIPTSAIQRNAQSAFVYLVKPDMTADMRSIQVGTTDGDVTAVQGVQIGETVVVNGFDKLQQGSKVTIADSSGQNNKSGQNDQNSGQNTSVATGGLNP